MSENKITSGTLIDYSELSDFEINKRVLEIKSGIKPLGYAHNADERSAGIVDVSDNYHWFDFCNSQVDAWPIIFGNKIGILWLESEKLWSAHSMGELEEGSWDWSCTPDHWFDDSNPLRAAMIVFLMMRRVSDE